MEMIKNMLKEFSSLLGNCLTIITLMLAAFLLLINLYHSKEIQTNYVIDMNNNESYLAYKEKINDLKIRVNDIDDYETTDQNKRAALSSIKTSFNECFNSIEKSRFNTIDTSKTSMNLKDIYDYNQELATNLQINCLFSVNYNIKNSIEQYKANITYNLYDELLNDRLNIVNYTTFLQTELLSNDNYYFTTEMTKNTVYNKISNYVTVNLQNYKELANNLEKMVVFYEDVSGGNK